MFVCYKGDPIDLEADAYNVRLSCQAILEVTGYLPVNISVALEFTVEFATPCDCEIAEDRKAPRFQNMPQWDRYRLCRPLTWETRWSTTRVVIARRIC